MSWRKDKVDQSIEALIRTNAMLMAGLKDQTGFSLALSRDLAAALKRIEALEKRLNDVL